MNHFLELLVDFFQFSIGISELREKYLTVEDIMFQQNREKKHETQRLKPRERAHMSATSKHGVLEELF